MAGGKLVVSKRPLGHICSRFGKWPSGVAAIYCIAKQTVYPGVQFFEQPAELASSRFLFLLPAQQPRNFMDRNKVGSEAFK